MILYIRCFKCVTTTSMLVFWSACLCCLPLCQSTFNGWFRSQGKYRATLEFKSSGCAVSNNFFWLKSQFVSFCQSYTVCTPHLFLQGEGGRGLNLQPNLQKRGGLTGPQFLDGVAGKEGVTFFRGGCNCYIINQNLKYLMTKTVFIFLCNN